MCGALAEIVDICKTGRQEIRGDVRRLNCELTWNEPNGDANDQFERHEDELF